MVAKAKVFSKKKGKLFKDQNVTIKHMFHIVVCNVSGIRKPIQYIP